MQFRKFAASAMAAVLLSAACAMPASAFDELNLLAGDADCNDAVNVADAVLMARFCAEDGEARISSRGKLNADLNGDGDVTAADLTGLLESLANLSHNESYGAVNLLEGYSLGGGQRTARDEVFRAAQMNFSAELFRTAAAKTEGNVLLSPTSAALALGMTANGAKGQTRAEMEQVLGSGLTAEQLNSYYQEMSADLTTKRSAKVSLANSIWVRDDESRIKVPEPFLQTIADHYNAGAFKAPFDDGTLKDVNNWISDHTGGMIKDMLKEISVNDIMYLINALYFENAWEEPYFKHQMQRGVFKPNAGELCSVDMMNSTEPFWIDDGRATGAAKWLEGCKFRYIAVMPNEDVSLDEYIAGLDGKALTALLDGIKTEPVELSMPKYKIECDVKLKETLTDMGMQNAFLPAADFTGLNSAGTSAHIAEVLHNTAMEVSESGVKAAAATVVKIDENGVFDDGPQHELTIDRPFIVIIADDELSLPLFIGAVREIGEPIMPPAAN